jgi:hypothetical protein
MGSSFFRLGLAILYGPKRQSASSSGVQCTMQKIMIFTVCLLLFVVVSCGRPTEENVIEVKDSAFKVDVRSQEFHTSGIRNVDICVADLAAEGFPRDKGQCFLHGFDFSGLSVKWRSERDLEISFDCGRVSSFSNFALLSKSRSIPVEFHATLHEACGTASTDVLGRDAHH